MYGELVETLLPGLGEQPFGISTIQALEPVVTVFTVIGFRTQGSGAVREIPTWLTDMIATRPDTTGPDFVEVPADQSVAGLAAVP